MTGPSFAVALCLWFNLYDWAAIALNTSGLVFINQRDVNGTYGGTNGAAISANTWYYVKIVVTASTVYFYSSSDGRTWSLITSIARPSTWIIDANSLLILGHGYEGNVGSYPNADWDNNATTGANQTSHVDDCKLVRSETIVINNLPDGYYFKVWDDTTLIGTSAGASGGSASLNISGYEDLMPFDKIELYDGSGQLKTTHKHRGCLGRRRLPVWLVEVERWKEK